MNFGTFFKIDKVITSIIFTHLVLLILFFLFSLLVCRNTSTALPTDVDHAGIGTAFLISDQDNGKVKVTKCTPKSTTTAEAIILEVVILDTDMNATYHRDIKVVPVIKAYQIDDVVEWD